MEKTLSRIAESRARVFVMDISGVVTVDTAVANNFIRDHASDPAHGMRLHHLRDLAERGANPCRVGRKCRGSANDRHSSRCTCSSPSPPSSQRHAMAGRRPGPHAEAMHRSALKGGGGPRGRRASCNQSHWSNPRRHLGRCGGRGCAFSRLQCAGGDACAARRRQRGVRGFGMRSDRPRRVHGVAEGRPHHANGLVCAA